MANIEKRVSGDKKISYRVKVRLKGFPVQSATFERRIDARKWARDTESAVRNSRHFKPPEAKRHTLAELIDRYIKTVLSTKPKSKFKQTAQLEWWKKQIGAYVLSLDWKRLCWFDSGFGHHFMFRAVTRHPTQL